MRPSFFFFYWLIYFETDFAPLCGGRDLINGQQPWHFYMQKYRLKFLWCSHFSRHCHSFQNSTTKEYWHDLFPTREERLRTTLRNHWRCSSFFESCSLNNVARNIASERVEAVSRLLREQKQRWGQIFLHVSQTFSPSLFRFWQKTEAEAKQIFLWRLNVNWKNKRKSRTCAMLWFTPPLKQQPERINPKPFVIQNERLKTLPYFARITKVPSRDSLTKFHPKQEEQHFHTGISGIFDGRRWWNNETLKQVNGATSGLVFTRTVTKPSMLTLLLQYLALEFCCYEAAIT